jgi:hypothetical protein
MIEMLEIAPGLRYWTAPHPAWNGATGWPEDVGCVYYEGPGELVLIDPLVPRDEAEAFWRMLDGAVERLGLPVAVLLTAPWHSRSAVEVADRYRTVVWTHDSDAGPLPTGVEEFVPGGAAEGQGALYLCAPRALVVAEIFMSVDGALRIFPSPASTSEEAAGFRTSLNALLQLSIDHVLLSHGEPVLNEGGRRIAEALGVNG